MTGTPGTPRPDAVVKVGGSLLSERRLGDLAATLGEVASRRRIVVSPGGGPFADAVRFATARHAADATTAHWMAVLAMDQYAHLLATLVPGARLVTDPAGIAAALDAGRAAVLAPFAWLRAADPLPHGWHVTGDSIAAWAAAALKARRLVLLKVVEGVTDADGSVLAEASPATASASGVVDGYFPVALGSSAPTCWIIDGRRPERLRELLAAGRTEGTWVR